MEEGRRFVRDIIANEQWDAFQQCFPDIEALVSFETDRGESILHLLAQYASYTFAHRVIRAYRLDDRTSASVKDLWAQRDDNGELCVNYKRFKKHVRDSLAAKVDAVYSGHYFAFPNKKWALRGHSTPREDVYRLFCRYALPAAFDQTEAGLKRQESTTEKTSGLRIYLREPGKTEGTTRSIPVWVDVTSRRSFLRQIYDQLDCPDAVMSPTLAVIWLVEKALKKDFPKNPTMQEAFRYFQSKQGVLNLADQRLSVFPKNTAQMYIVPGSLQKQPMIVACCPERVALPASLHELLKDAPCTDWVYNSCQNQRGQQEMTETLFHELFHVADLSQEHPLSQSKLFMYSVLCLLSRMGKKDHALKEFMGVRVLTQANTPQVFIESAAYLMADAESSDNQWLKHVRAFMMAFIHGIDVPAVVNRAHIALADWDSQDIKRMDSLVNKFARLHTRQCPLWEKTKGRAFEKQWERFVVAMDKLLGDFFKENEALPHKVASALINTMQDMTILSKRPQTWGRVVLSEGWLRLLHQYVHPLLPFPEMAVFTQMYQMRGECPQEADAKRGLVALAAECPLKIKSEMDFQSLLDTLLCAQRVDELTGNTQTATLWTSASYQDLVGGKVARALKKYATSCLPQPPQTIARRKRAKESKDKDHQKED